MRRCRSRRSGSARSTRGSARTSRTSPRQTKSWPPTTSGRSTRSSRPGSTARSRSSRPSWASTSMQMPASHTSSAWPSTPPPTGSYLWVDMEGSAYVEAHDRAVRATPGGPAADRDLPPGVPPPDRGGHRAAAAARSGHPPRQGRLRRAGIDRLHGTGGASTPASSASRSRFLLDGRGRPIRLGLGTHDVTLIEQIAEQVVSGRDRTRRVRGPDAVRHPRPTSSSGWQMRAIASRPSSPTASTGIRGTCGAWPSDRRTSWFALRQMLP